MHCFKHNIVVVNEPNGNIQNCINLLQINLAVELNKLMQLILKQLTNNLAKATYYHKFNIK